MKNAFVIAEARPNAVGRKSGSFVATLLELDVALWEVLCQPRRMCALRVFRLTIATPCESCHRLEF